MNDFRRAYRVDLIDAYQCLDVAPLCEPPAKGSVLAQAQSLLPGEIVDLFVAEERSGSIQIKAIFKPDNGEGKGVCGAHFSYRGVYLVQWDGDESA